MNDSSKKTPSWITQELQGANLGDKRLNERLLDITAALNNNPEQSIPVNFNSWGELKATYRFFNNNKVTSEKILEPHCKATLERIKEESVVLLLQDTTDIDFTGRKTITGMGVTGSATQQYFRRGFFFHPTIAVTPEKTCLGVVNSQVWVRKERIGRLYPYVRNIEEKESNKWLRSLKNTNVLAHSTPNTLFVNINDREGDVYELFSEANSMSKNVHFVIRSSHNRKLVNNRKLWDEVTCQKPVGIVKFTLPDGRGGRKSRKVIQEVRIANVELKPPYRKDNLLETVKLNIVRACEINTPPNVKPVEWLLITSLDVNNYNDATKIIDYYMCRWQIELYFKILKSGCQIERLQLESLDRIEKCLAVYMIIAWRILFLTILGRSHAELPCDKVFSEAEWKSVYITLYKTHPPEVAPSLRLILRMIANLGGFIGRSSDKEPGIKAMWLGMQRMRDLALSFEAMQIVMTKHTYG